MSLASERRALAGAFARVAHERGSSVSYGRCDEDLGLPYQPWATAVAHLMDHCPPGVLDEVVTTYSPDLARLGPALSHLAPDSSPSGDPEIGADQLFSVVAVVFSKQRVAPPALSSYSTISTGVTSPACSCCDIWSGWSYLSRYLLVVGTYLILRRRTWRSVR